MIESDLILLKLTMKKIQIELEVSQIRLNSPTADWNNRMRSEAPTEMERGDTRMTAAHRMIVALHNIHRPPAEATKPATKITERTTEAL
jgi:hypothetical protein